MKTVNRVFVVDRKGNPLMPCHPARARKLLRKGRAAVYRRYPFTILLKDREARDDGKDIQTVRLKIDPGSKVTGISLVGEFQCGKTVIWAAELYHRGEQIRTALLERRSLRRLRRNRKTRYRAPRYLNRRRPKGWLPPSIMSRVFNVFTWVRRLRKFVPLAHLSLELARFDTQKLQNPEIKGIEYQQGTLFGYEVKEYLLDKFGRRCVYCDVENVPFEIEHVIPRSKGGSDRVSNLVIACHDCNREKDNRSLEEFLAHDPERAGRIKAQLKTPLRDAAAINASRWVLFDRLKELGLELEIGTGGRTKYNRSAQ
ncbi:RNA-guided endonuclease IscB [Caldalkalibacillus thermarum]|uniref:RNA-guided endonuclease IscB n=1 Tax=Caldalkalibacillus thermarum TaxID=296745 RepID=UPI001E655163|nr:RNA-guided endonuclease IscB [Caldalkalibacillus thermarum]